MRWVRGTKSGAAEGSMDSRLVCHWISWATAMLKFTAVNIPNRQLSLPWPVPVITTRLVRYVAWESAKRRKMKWPALGPLIMYNFRLYMMSHDESSELLSSYGHVLVGNKNVGLIGTSGKFSHPLIWPEEFRAPECFAYLFGGDKSLF